MEIKTSTFEIFKCPECGKISWKPRRVADKDFKCLNCIAKKIQKNILINNK